MITLAIEDRQCVHEAQSKSMAEQAGQSLHSKPRGQLLVVDDEAPIREVLKSYLDKQGFQVATAATEAETLKIVRALSIDLVILDVVLEDTDGLDLLQKLKRSRPSCPVIIITGLAEDEEIKRQALERGASECISKVSPLDQLSASIDRALASVPAELTRSPTEPPRRARRASASRAANSPKASRRAGPATERRPRGGSAESASGETAKTSPVADEAIPDLPLSVLTGAKPGPPAISEAVAAPLQDALAIPVAQAPTAEAGVVARFISVTPEAALLQPVVEVFLKMLGAFHPNLANTAMRAVYLCKTLGEILHLSTKQLQDLLWAAALQDISLVQFDRELLNRWLRGSEKCSKRELALLRRHPERSQRMLDFVPVFKGAGEIILAHHENWDGSGYPVRLRMEMIPWLARLLSVVLFYCAKHAPTEKTLLEIQTQANQFYDPRAVEAVVKAAALTTLPKGQRELLAAALRPSMILAGDILNWKGVLILGQETELNQNRITRLVHLAELGQIEPRVLVWA